MRIFRFSAIVVAVFTVSQQTPAQYQDFYGGSWNNGGSALASTIIWNCVYLPLACKKTGGASKSSTSPTPSRQTSATKPGPTIGELSVRFKFSGTFIKTRELADQLGNTQAEREQYQKLMNAVLDAFGQQAKKAGFPNDIPAALAFFFGENFRIYRGMPELSDRQYADLRNRIADAVITSGALISMTDRQKQEMYETLIAYTGITQYGYEQGVQAQNDAIIKGYKKVAGQSLQTVTKMSPDNINIGPNRLTTP